MARIDTDDASAEAARLDAMLAELNEDRPEASGSSAPAKPEAEPAALLRLVAGPFAADVARVFRGPRLVGYMMAPDARRHAWHCWFASDRARLEQRFRADADATFDRLTSVKTRELVTLGYGACPAGLPAALGKCGAKARSAEFYRALVRALARQDFGAKFLRHAGELTDALVFNVAALPTRLQTKPLFEALRAGSLAGADLAFFAWAASRVETLGAAGNAEAVAKAGKPLEALGQAFRALPFPPPPWPGDDRLRPLTSRDELRRVGWALRNCLRHSSQAEAAAVEVARQVRYYYEWVGNEPGLLCFRSAFPLGWMLQQAEGIENSPLSGRTWAEIEANLLSHPEVAPIWVDECGGLLGTGFIGRHLF